MLRAVLAQAFCALLVGLLWAPFSCPGMRPLMLPLALAWAACMLCSSSVACWVRAGWWAVAATALTGCVLAGAVARSMHHGTAGRMPGSARVTGQVASALEWQHSMFDEGDTVFASFYVDLRSVEAGGAWQTGRAERVRCTLVSATPCAIERGDMVTMRGRLERIPAATNPGQFDMAAHFARLGIYHRLVVRDGWVRWRAPVSLSLHMRMRRVLDRVRARAARTLHGGARRAEESAILRRMLLGTRDTMPEELNEVFTRTNTFHIIAISGLHMGIVWGLCWSALWLAGVPGRYRAGCVLPLLWLYAMMVGLRPSVVRAMLMFTGLALAPLCGRPGRATMVLLAVACVYVVSQPQGYASMGTLLTFVSVCSLLAGAPLLNRALMRSGLVRDPEVYDFEHRHYRYVRIVTRFFLRIACGTGAIWLLTWPITLTRSNLVTPGAWLANLLVIPMLSVVLGLGFAAVLAGVLWSWLGSAVCAVALELLHGLVWCMEAVASLPGSFFAAPCLTAWSVFCYYSALLLTWLWAYWRGHDPCQPSGRQRVVWLAACAAWLLFARDVLQARPTADSVRAVMLDVGLGDAAVVHTPGGAHVVVDGGVSFGPWSQGARVVVPYLRYAGVNTLDAVICSHFDRDHCGGLADVLTAFDVRAVYAPPVLDENRLAGELRALATRRGIAWHTWFAGVTQHIGGATFVVLHPPAVVTNFAPAAAAWGDNTWSLVVSVEHAGRRMLFTGDATRATEALLCAAGRCGRADVLKVGHHGSASSTSVRFLDRVQPSLSTISVGENHMNLPSARVVQRILRRGMACVRTDEGGALDVRFRRNGIAISTFRPMRTGLSRPCTRTSETR